MVARSIAAVKRHLSDSESEFIEETCSITNELLNSPESHSEESEGYSTARKKRRGLIEKRRRDRINRSLNELKSLIPTVNERQASAKLEKSEVLSLAVDHIKSLQLKDNASPRALAMDYRGIGFRECINEMIAYLVNIEGLGPADPLHNRIVSHLHQQASAIEHTSNYYYMGGQSPPQSTCYPPVEQIVCKPEPPSPTYSMPLEGHSENSYMTYNRYNSNCPVNIPCHTEQYGHNYPTSQNVHMRSSNPHSDYYPPPSNWM